MRVILGKLIWFELVQRLSQKNSNHGEVTVYNVFKLSRVFQQVTKFNAYTFGLFTLI